MARPPPSEDSPGRSREPPVALVIRLLLVAAAFGLLWLAADRLAAIRDFYATQFAIPRGAGLQVVGVAAASGVLFGLAVVLPRSPWRYGVVRTVAAAILPGAMVAVSILAFARPGFELVPSWMIAFLEPFGFGFLVFWPVVFGVALTAGFTASGPGPSPASEAAH